MVQQMGDPEELATQIDSALTNHEHDERELREYLTALFEESFVIPGGGFSSTKDNAASKADAIYPHIQRASIEQT
jgi:hypothetical protein